jgi:predicted nucleotide-binding protein (sugar kinase/HSP70/actin superfamily)
MFQAAAQSIADGFANGMARSYKEAMVTQEAITAAIKARYEKTTEIDEAIRHSCDGNDYFVLTSEYKVVLFGNKEALNSFLIEQLDNQTYGILMAHSYDEWIRENPIERHYQINKVIMQNERAEW